MKKFRKYTALVLRAIGYVLNIPSSILYSLSNIIKNEEDVFNF